MHTCRNDCYYLIVAATTACGAFCCVFNIIKNIEQVVDIAVIVYGVDYIKIAHLIAILALWNML